LLWWGGGVQDQHFDFDVRNWDELSKRYFEAFERLKMKEYFGTHFLEKTVT
jgi:hypothetical protein